MINAFAFVVKDIKTNAGKVGKLLEDAEIIEKLSLTEEEYKNYLSKDAPIGLLQKIMAEFADYTRITLTEVVYESEKEAPDPFVPDDLED
ncbi:hypothetical protein SAMN05660909_00977 [Chitinophaga terrae (ex Kim and Jung 2007)]|uniref:XRE family transcriptional regulator n=2 Tax=Chitinophaga terrae (ex Kim and Jung 2007) TaxID=408074 RepID=A0A1H3YVR6_9BACT|nr:hypothetical protein [Chitinophaga terrae (ex Kim and Jung 2007)]GEP88516.1 hypothetical protein CTE07_01610 [Chitinophaga terrae (ex Kim and Jung 2007)]SEA15281.1 hypothetical protein SAMN05660909_00977 [Chitinophaga terrae (ex Kim and Jung 2007)]